MSSPYIEPPTIREGLTIPQYRHERPGKRSWPRTRRAVAWLAHPTRRSIAG